MKEKGCECVLTRRVSTKVMSGLDTRGDKSAMFWRIFVILSAVRMTSLPSGRSKWQRRFKNPLCC